MASIVTLADVTRTGGDYGLFMAVRGHLGDTHRPGPIYRMHRSDPPRCARLRDPTRVVVAVVGRLVASCRGPVALVVVEEVAKPL